MFRMLMVFFAIIVSSCISVIGWAAEVDPHAAQLLERAKTESGGNYLASIRTVHIVSEVRVSGYMDQAAKSKLSMSRQSRPPAWRK